MGEAQLPQVVSGLRPAGGREAHGGGEQLQLQIPLVLHGELRRLCAGCSQIRVREEGRRGLARLQAEEPRFQIKPHISSSVF